MTPLAIVDPESDEPVAPGEVGEIVVRPREPSCFMAGYYRMPEKTVEAWRNLWFHTGDAARFDDQGRVFYVDRIKDRIRRRGENISAFEVEQVLNQHPAIAESAVVGIKTEDAGGEEEVKACIVLSGGAELDNIALLDYCAFPTDTATQYFRYSNALSNDTSPAAISLSEGMGPRRDLR